MQQQQKYQVIYSVPSAQPTKQGETAIYKKPNSEFKLSPEPGIETLQDILLTSSVKFANKNFLGTRNIVGQYEYKTFKQCFDSAKEVGSAILNQKLFYHSDKEYQNFDMKFIGVLSKNRTEWVELEMANFLYNFTMVPLYDTMTVPQIEFILEQTQITTLFVSDKLLERVLQVKNQANLKNIVTFDELPCLEIIQQFAATKGLKLNSWNQLKQIGKQNIQEFVKVKPDDIFTLSYTSGTTGVNKAVMLSHKIFVASIASLVESEICTNENDVHLSYLPLSHAYERIVINMNLYQGAITCFSCGDILKLKDDLVDAKPTIFATVPRVLNKFYTVIQDVLSRKSPEEKAFFDKAFQDKQKDLNNPNGSIYTNPEIDDKFFKFTKGIFGGRVRKIFTAAAPISSEVVEFFKIVMCCPVLEAYGQTEDIGSLFLTQSKDATLKGTVGGPTINTEFKLLDVLDMNYFSTDKDQQGNSQPRGEICVRGCVMSAYFKDQQQTDATLDKDGFVHTGDIVQILPNGSVKIIDRRSNFFKLAQGEYIAPEKLENIYVRAPGVQEIFVYGDREKSYLVGIVVPSPEYLTKYAQANNIKGDLTQLCQYEVIKNHILDNLNKHANKEELLGFEKLKEIFLEPVSFIVHGACTPSFKMKRNEAKKIFSHVLQDLYNEHEVYKEQKHSPSPKKKQK